MRKIASCFQVVGPIAVRPPACTVVAVVGPTGVGKTTTVAKLASHFSVVEKRNVGLITVDLYRIAAVEQLRVYADLLGVPLEVVVTPADLRRALGQFASKDLVLIDTAGRSPYNWMQVLELSGFFKGIEPLDVHLVLSAATRSRENLATVKRFSAMALHKVIFTKLDESSDFGVLLNVAVLGRKPISYLTTGQKVPEDIEVASAEKLARVVLGEPVRWTHEPAGAR